MKIAFVLCALFLVLGFVYIEGGCSSAPHSQQTPSKENKQNKQDQEVKQKSNVLPPLGREESAPIVFEALKMAKNGEIERAISALRQHIKEVPNALYGRIVLGKLLDFDGNPEEAVSVWKAGLSGTEVDINIWNAIAEVRLRQGEDGPFVSYRREIVTYKAKSADVDVEKYKQAKIEEAVEALFKIHSLDPTDTIAVGKLAKGLGLLGRKDEAADLWCELSSDNSNNGMFFVECAKALQAIGKNAEMLNRLERAIAMEPRLWQAHDQLAKYYDSIGERAKAIDEEEKAKFYSWLPPFATTMLSPEVDNLFKKINELGKDTSKKQSASTTKIIADLKKKNTAISRDFIAAILLQHDAGHDFENELFSVLEKWNASSTLVGLAKHAESTCTAKGAFMALARLKDPNVFEMLINALPDDTRFMFSVDVAKALEILGDPRAVTPLSEIVNPDLVQPELTEKGNDDSMMTGHGRLYARARAALALGEFNTDESLAMLEKGSKNKQIAMYCEAALLRLTGEESHAKALEKLSETMDDSIGAMMIYEYLIVLKTPVTGKLAELFKRKL